MSEVFGFTMNPLELVLRGTLMYLGLVLVMRFLLRRDMGPVSTPDLLFIVLVADAAQNAMVGGYKSLSDGAVLVGTLVGWITREELESRLRESGIDDVALVHRAVLEPSGELGIIRRDEKSVRTTKKRPQTA